MNLFIITLITVGALSCSVAAGFLRLDDQDHQTASAMRVAEGFRDIERGYYSYFSARLQLPHALPDIAPTYAFIPPALSGMQWTYVNSDDAVLPYVCLSGTANKFYRTAVLQARYSLQQNRVFINDSCAASQTDLPDAAAEEAAVAMTYWLDIPAP